MMGCSNDFEVKYDEFKHCKYCGSMHPVELANLINEGRATLQGCDWKYGWPHKFYVTIDGSENAGKFYVEHFYYITEDELNMALPVINKACGIEFKIIQSINDIIYKAPYYNYQKV